jgi:hypothetical protein
MIRLLSLLGTVLAISTLILVPSETGRAQSDHTILGLSQLGIPLVVYHLGTGARPVFIMSGQHGGPERNTVALGNQLWDYFAANPGEIPAGMRLDFMTEGNPDGLVRGSRLYVSGVDPNRNWGGFDWQSDAWDSNAVFRTGLGGSAPFSEPETQAVRDYLLNNRPALTINYHSRGGFLFGGRGERSGQIADAYASASRYARPTPGTGSSPLSYRATGSMNVWMGEEGLAGMLIELTTFDDPEFSRNLAGVRAALRILAAE